nr:hypothetical protein [Candidatus Dormibacteraeota bacterium]
AASQGTSGFPAGNDRAFALFATTSDICITTGSVRDATAFVKSCSLHLRCIALSPAWMLASRR